MSIRKYALVDLLPEHARVLSLQIYMDLRKAQIETTAPLTTAPIGVDSLVGSQLDLLNSISTELRMELSPCSCIIVPQTIYALPSIRNLEEGLASPYDKLAAEHAKTYSVFLSLPNMKNMHAAPYGAESRALVKAGVQQKIRSFSSTKELRNFIVSQEKLHQASGASFENGVGYENTSEYFQWVKMNIPRSTFNSMSHRYTGYVPRIGSPGIYSNPDHKIQLRVI